VVGAVFAPAATVVGAIADEGQADLIKEMDRNVIASVPIVFKADPGTGNKAKKIFVKLDFVDLPPPDGTPKKSSGGVIISLEYQASVFLRNASFYRDITATSAEILSTVIRTAAGDKTIASQVSEISLNALRFTATTPAAFDVGCGTVRNELATKGLSSVDSAVFVWALASANPNDSVNKKVWEIPCINSAKADLAKVGIAPPPPPTKPPEVAKRQATLAEMHKAMDNMATLMQLGRVDPQFFDLEQRFAENVTLIVDEHTRALLQLTDTTLKGDRDTILQLLATHFTRLGCYGPRLSSPDLQLPTRPEFVPLATGERAAAAVVLFGGRDGVTAEPFVISFKFAPASDSHAAQIDTISIAQRGADVGPVIKELTEGRRPKSCTENWMDPIFSK
jgi:hypothetical protein